MSTDYAPGLHVVTGQAVDVSAYDRWVGRWSRLFVPSLLAAAQVSPGSVVLDVSTGTGEAALAALPVVGASGMLVGADIAPEMLEAGARRIEARRYFDRWPLMARHCRSRMAPSMRSLPTRAAVLSRSRPGTAGVPACPASGRPGGGMRDLDTGSGADVGCARRYAQPAAAGATQCPPSVVCPVRPEEAGKPVRRGGLPRHSCAAGGPLRHHRELRRVLGGDRDGNRVAAEKPTSPSPSPTDAPCTKRSERSLHNSKPTGNWL